MKYQFLLNCLTFNISVRWQQAWALVQLEPARITVFLCLVGATIMPGQTVVWEHLQYFASRVKEANNYVRDIPRLH